MIDLEKLKKLNEICHEVTVMWFDKEGRPSEGSDPSGSPTLMPEIAAEIEAMRAVLEATGKAMDVLGIKQKDCEIEELKKSLSHFQHQSIDHVQAIASLNEGREVLRESVRVAIACGDTQRAKIGELEKELEQVIKAKVQDLASAKIVVLAAHNRLSAPNVTMYDLRNDPVVYAVNKLVEDQKNKIIEDLRAENVQLKKDIQGSGGGDG